MSTTDSFVDHRLDQSFELMIAAKTSSFTSFFFLPIELRIDIYERVLDSKPLAKSINFADYVLSLSSKGKATKNEKDSWRISKTSKNMALVMTDAIYSFNPSRRMVQPCSFISKNIMVPPCDSMLERSNPSTGGKMSWLQNHVRVKLVSSGSTYSSTHGSYNDVYFWNMFGCVECTSLWFTRALAC